MATGGATSRPLPLLGGAVPNVELALPGWAILLGTTVALSSDWISATICDDSVLKTRCGLSSLCRTTASYSTKL